MWGNLTSIYNRYRYLFYGIFLLTVILPVSNCSYKQRSAERKRTELEETINTFLAISNKTHHGNDPKVFRTALDLRSKAVEIADTAAIIRITSYICARYNSVGDYINALRYLNLIPVSSDSTARNVSFRKTGLFRKLNQLDSALYYTRKSVEYGVEENVCDAVFGEIYLRMDSLDKAEYYLLKSIKVNSLNAKPYRDLAILYDKRGIPDKAEEIYNTVNTIAKNARSYNSRFLIAIIYSYNYARYLVGQERYSEAERILRDGCKSYAGMIPDKSSKNELTPYSKFYISSLELLDSLYNSSKSVSVAERIGVKDSLLSAKKRYDMYSKNKSVDNSYVFDKIQREHNKALEDARYKRRVFIITTVVGVYFFVTLILLIFLYYRRKNRAKNRIIIQEAEKKAKSLGTAIYDSTIIRQRDSDGKYITLFKQIEKLFTEEEIFKNDNLNRKQIAVALGTNENYIQTAIRLYTNGMTVSDYINSYRIKCACEYIEENPDVKVVEIAYACGFANRDTFYKTFERIMHVTFKEYKETKY